MHFRLQALLAAAALALPLFIHAAPANQRELADLLLADQADRTPGPNGIDWKVVWPRDLARQARVKELLKDGEVRTADDYYAAAMVFQHGEGADEIRLAHALAFTAWQMKPDHALARWLVAASWDRLMMRLKRPQWYGTQFSKPQPDQPWVLYDIDETVVSDAERAQMGVPTLAESKARVAELNR